MTEEHDEFKAIDTPEGVHLAACPVCGAQAGLWRYSDAPDLPTETVVMCSNGEKFGPQDGLVNEGCLLYLPPDCFYRPTIRDAAIYWNKYAKALIVLRGTSEEYKSILGMADCMHMVREELIEAGIIDKTVPPMFVANAVCSFVKKQVAAKQAIIDSLNKGQQ